MKTVSQISDQLKTPTDISLDQLEEIIELQASILSDISTGEDTNTLFEKLCLSAEKLTNDALASIMVLDESGQQLYVHSAPSIPDVAIDELNGLKRGDGSCGNAVHHNEPQYVCNTMTDSRWINVVGFAKKYNIHACWSCPIRDKNNKPFGSFALSSFETREPNSFQQRLLSSCASIAGILFQRLESERENRKKESRYRSMIENSSDGIFMHEADGTIIDVNQAACDLDGYSRDELIGMNVTDVEASFPPGFDFTEFTASLDYDNTVTVPGMHRTKNGEEIPVEVRVRCYQEGNLRRFAAMVRDITNRKRAEQERLKASKLESIGVLAGGIAHDFNNLLGSIMGGIDLAKNSLQDPERIKLYLSRSENASKRAADLTQQLLTFSRGGDPIKQNADITEIIQQSCEFVLHGSNIDTHFDFGTDLGMIECDSGQISQVIQNLVINARQAMPDGGTLDIRCNNKHFPQNIRELGISAGDYVEIEVTDSGEGIPDKIINTIFDPYFTTKEDGSGLGLAVSYSVITKHGGRILVDSEAGEGTTFSVYLPNSITAKDPVNHDQHEKDENTDNLLVMVMDDDELIQQVCADMLDINGHRSVVAGDGESAVESYRKHMEKGQHIDLIIMDLTIPSGMGGQETIRKIQEMDPDAKAIVSSGYSNDPVMANYTDYGFCGAISKPYTSDSLESAIRQVID